MKRGCEGWVTLYARLLDPREDVFYHRPVCDGEESLGARFVAMVACERKKPWGDEWGSKGGKHGTHSFPKPARTTARNSRETRSALLTEARSIGVM
jgi:hypothetical protein